VRWQTSTTDPGVLGRARSEGQLSQPAGNSPPSLAPSLPSCSSPPATLLLARVSRAELGPGMAPPLAAELSRCCAEQGRTEGTDGAFVAVPKLAFVPAPNRLVVRATLWLRTSLIMKMNPSLGPAFTSAPVMVSLNRGAYSHSNGQREEFGPWVDAVSFRLAQILPRLRGRFLLWKKS